MEHAGAHSGGWRGSARRSSAGALGVAGIKQYVHRHGSRGHGRSHVMPALVPPYATIPVLAGDLALGTWQSICLVDLNIDNAERQVRLSFLTG